MFMKLFLIVRAALYSVVPEIPAYKYAEFVAYVLHAAAVPDEPELVEREEL
jgi:hypothetical protein